MPKIDDQPDDPFDNLVLDEDFVKAAEHKEGSARARMLSARWRKNPPKDTSWRAPVAQLKPRRRRRWQLPLFVLLAVGLVLVSLNAGKVHDWAFSKAPGAKAAPAANQYIAPALTASPTAAPPTPFADQSPDLRHPFAGSPADRWPSGAAGIALPAAKSVGIFSTSTVAKDEQLVKDYLVAAYLDPRTLAGGYPQAALDLLAPDSASWMRQMVDHPTPKADGIMLTSRFDPKVAVPVGDVRVQGEVSLTGDGDNGLRIRTDFAFVYASHPVGSAEVERTIARRILTFRFYDPYRYQALPAGTVWIENADGFTGDQLCGFTNGYLVPYFQTTDPSGSATATPSGTPVDPYDMSRMPGSKSDCSMDTRS